MLEHEGKALLRRVGVATPAGRVLVARDDAAAWDGGYPVAVKAQVRGGGRGKQGGVLRADDAAALTAALARVRGLVLDGASVDAVLVEPWQPHDRELYLSLVVDGRANGYVLLYAPRGGVDIESGPPPARYPFGDPSRFRVHELRVVLERTEHDYRVRERVIALAERLVATADGHDCTTIEINPLAVLEDGSLVALDAKVVRDEWAAFRNEEIRALVADERGRADALLRASLEMGHMYVRLDGDIGLISGGAGMTMGAMDVIAAAGGRPACFLDASPGPTSTRGYRPALAMLDADPAVKVILVSVFGGGTQMQRVANAMKDLMAERTSDKPVIFRLDGTNVDQVPAILATFGAHNHATMESAAQAAVALARGRGDTAAQGAHR